MSLVMSPAVAARAIRTVPPRGAATAGYIAGQSVSKAHSPAFPDSLEESVSRITRELICEAIVAGDEDMDVACRDDADSDDELDDQPDATVDFSPRTEHGFRALSPSPFDVDVDDDVITSKDVYRDHGTMKYLNNIDRYTLLTPDEEISLGREVQKGNQAAITRLIRCNLKLVVSVAKRYISRSGLQFDDLVQEGNIGLITAVMKFNPEMGFRMSTYAVPWIEQKIKLACKQKSNMIRLPSHVTERIGKATRALEAGKRNKLPEAELAALQVNLDAVIQSNLGGDTQLLHQRTTIASLDPGSTNSSADDESAPSIGAMLADYSQNPERRLEMIQAISIMQKALEAVASNEDLSDYCHKLETKDGAKLTAGQIRGRNRYILELRSGLNEDLEAMTLEQVGNVISITREGVRIIYRRVAPIFMDELARLAGGLENLPIDIAL